MGQQACPASRSSDVNAFDLPEAPQGRGMSLDNGESGVVLGVIEQTERRRGPQRACQYGSTNNIIKRGLSN